MPYVYYPFTKKDKHGDSVWELRKIKCPSCDEYFTTRNPDKVYCSRKCKHREIMRRNRNGKKKSDNPSK